MNMAPMIIDKTIHAARSLTGKNTPQKQTRLPLGFPLQLTKHCPSCLHQNLYWMWTKICSTAHSHKNVTLWLLIMKALKTEVLYLPLSAQHVLLHNNNLNTCKAKQHASPNTIIFYFLSCFFDVVLGWIKLYRCPFLIREQKLRNCI